MAEADAAPRPSRLFVEHLDALRDAGRLGPVVDLACGRGRHALAGVRAGLPMIGVDVSREHLRTLTTRAEAWAEHVPCIRADLEAAAEIPIAPGSCGAVLVFRFLFRPLASKIVDLLAPGGLLLYETFTLAQRDLPYGPSNPDFLLGPDELPALFAALDTVSYAEAREGHPRPDAVARLVARKPTG